jgi:hypothetical protein
LLIVGQAIAVYLWQRSPDWWLTTTHAILG